MRIGARFTGPPTSANGGVAAGLLAELLGPEGATGAVEVTLRRPPPLEVDLTVTDGSLYDGDLLLAEARHVSPDLAPPPPVSLAQAVGLSDVPGHAFPTCFVCGTSGPTACDCSPGRSPTGRSPPRGPPRPWRA